MECLGPNIASTPLNRLLIPGTHNSGIYSAAFKARLSRKKISDVISPQILDRMKHVLSWGLVGWDTLMELLENWAICQELSVSEQLTAGVRYLDFRVCEDYNNRLFLCHKIYGADFLAVLDEIRDFLDTHTKEIVIIDIHKIHMYSGKQSVIARALMKKFKSLLITDRLDEEVNTLWMKNKRVVILYPGGGRF